MCHAKPGPRCTGHARDRMYAAQTAAAQANVASDQAVRQVIAGKLPDKTARALSRVARAAEDKALRARTDWEATPGGQRDLAAQIAAARNPYQRNLLQQRRDAGAKTRAAQTAAYAAERGTAPVGDGTGQPPQPEPQHPAPSADQHRHDAYTFEQACDAGYQPDLLCESSETWQTRDDIREAWKDAAHAYVRAEPGSPDARWHAHCMVYAENQADLRFPGAPPDDRAW